MRAPAPLGLLALLALLALPQGALADPDPASPAGTDQSPGSAEAPPVVHDRAADRFWPAAAMAAAEQAMMAPAPPYAAMKVDLAEYQLGAGADRWRWEGEGWAGDVNRLLLRTRGEGAVGRRLDEAEVEAAYARAISPWWNLEAGVRQDIRPTPARSHAMLAAEGMAPYLFDVLAAAYLSDRGQLTGRIEASVDQRLTRRLVLQPRMELNLSAQDMPAERLGAGLTSAELGLRLRFEITRRFAPYVGAAWTWRSGRTAAYARAEGEGAAARSLVLGVKGWF
ncbi:MAG TPA: copper resistance protein B [Novosphingobium sp.]|nr:copper resistance protein B [Novosphingobium sp.]